MAEVRITFITNGSQEITKVQHIIVIVTRATLRIILCYFVLNCSKSDLRLSIIIILNNAIKD